MDQSKPDEKQKLVDYYRYGDGRPMPQPGPLPEVESQVSGANVEGLKRDCQSPQSLLVSLPDLLVRMKDSKVYGTSVSLGRAISRVDFSLCPGYDLFIYFASSSMNSAAYEGRYRRESHATRAQRPKGLPS
jgi:hypothetical protein